jgi:type VI protein secretion system component VasK
MIKPLRLVRVAAKAQGLALRRQIAGVVRRAILWVIAGIFALGALIVLHVIGYMALGEYAHFQPIASAAIVLGVDVLIAAIFGFLASATASDQSLEQARQSLTLASMVAPLTRVLSDMGILRAALGLVKAGFRRRREG